MFLSTLNRKQRGGDVYTISSDCRPIRKQEIVSMAVVVAGQGGLSKTSWVDDGGRVEIVVSILTLSHMDMIDSNCSCTGRVAMRMIFLPLLLLFTSTNFANAFQVSQSYNLTHDPPDLYQKGAPALSRHGLWRP